MKKTWDIFCSVVDNYGDIGVCWRLARQLSRELDQSVRLWVDDLASFHRLCPAVNEKLDRQSIESVDIRHWQSPFPLVEPASIVIEGFGVKLPANYIAAMATAPLRPVWVNLEHISAETWVDSCHGLPSPHPMLPLTKYFFFPGFTPATGGLLIERALEQTRDKFQSDEHSRKSFFQTLRIAAQSKDTVYTSLFSYENAALRALVEAWSSGERAIHCSVPESGAVIPGLSKVLGVELRPGMQVVRGHLTISAIPFLDVDQYDRLLWVCDINFVRGEDSFVRAQLAARPLVWQAYVQSDAAHLTKQAAFLDRYVKQADATTAQALRAIHSAWNKQSQDIGHCWDALMKARAPATAHARRWAAEIADSGNLVNRLAEFCQDRLK